MNEWKSVGVYLFIYLFLWVVTLFAKLPSTLNWPFGSLCLVTPKDRQEGHCCLLLLPHWCSFLHNSSITPEVKSQHFWNPAPSWYSECLSIAQQHGELLWDRGGAIFSVALQEQDKPHLFFTPHKDLWEMLTWLCLSVKGTTAASAFFWHSSKIQLFTNLSSLSYSKKG